MANVSGAVQIETGIKHGLSIPFQSVAGRTIDRRWDTTDLARECIPREDIASQVMCELGAYTMDLALLVGAETEHLPVGEVALRILAPPGSAPQVIADAM